MYNHELAEQVRQQGESLTDEANIALCPLVQAGDVVARERMITGNMPLVVECVNTFIQAGRTWLGYLRDDLTSAGFLGLVGAVNNIARHKKLIENPTTYLGSAIRAKLFDLIGIEQNVRCPRTNRWNPHNELEDAKLPCTVVVDMEKLPVSSEIRAVDLRDFIERACCHDDSERQMIRLCEEGYTQMEISRQVGVSQTKVSIVLRRIETQVKQEWYQ